MTSYLGAAFLAVGFAVMVKMLDLVRHAGSAVALSSDAMKVMADAALSDDQKERAMQIHAAKLFRLFVILTAGGIAALVAPAAIIWVLDLAGLLSFDSVMRAALSWPFLAGATVVAIALLWLLGRTRRGIRE